MNEFVISYDIIIICTVFYTAVFIIHPHSIMIYNITYAKQRTSCSAPPLGSIHRRNLCPAKKSKPR